MSSVLPQNLNYNFIKPTGFPCKIRQEKYTPIAFSTAGSGVSSSDVIRFNISSDGYWDPYSAYLKIEVDVSGMDGKSGGTAGQNCGSQQLDNSAQSFVNQLIIQKDGTELERIEEYDVLAALLNDIHGSNDNRATRYQEGMSGQQLNHGNQYNNQSYIAASVAVLDDGTCTQQGFAPFQNTQYGASGNLLANNALKLSSTATLTYAPNRYEYMLLYEDCKQSLQPTNTTLSVTLGVQNAALTNGLCHTANQLAGYRQPFCPQLSSYGSEPLLSKNILQMTTYKGALGQLIIGDRMTFCIPILSGLLGVLMPQESYKFIPMKALQDLIIEFRLNPHALFTSGYADQTTSRLNDTALGGSTTPMLSRSFKITKFELNVEMQYFEQDIDNIILSRFNTEQGIILHSQSYQLGPRYSIPANTNANGTYQVNASFESLKTVLFCFIPDDYLTYSFCRKQYRLSQNITQMYLKLGNQYYPPLPITGHAGTASTYSSANNDTDANNTEFICQLYSAFGKLNDINSGSIINCLNFAVNQRAYNPTNVAALFTATGTKYNLDTALSQPLFHENRCVGRACYGLNLETLQNDNSLLSGFRTKLITPYEITLKSDQTNAYPRPVTMFIFQNYDLLVQINKNGVTLYK